MLTYGNRSMTTSTTFGDWVLQELNSRGWDQAELARRSGISDAHISRVVTGGRKPGADAVQRIARALRLPAEEVFRRAGLLPPRGATADDLARYDDMLSTIASLTPENQRLVFDLVERIRRSEEAARNGR